MDIDIKKPELLSPAGSFDALKAAVKAGCDAVYLGGSLFGARAFADNFDEKTMLEAIDYMHSRGKALHLTVNTLLKEEEIKRKLYDYLLPFYLNGIDAVIVQDLGVMRFIREHFPDLPIHCSTQMGIMSAKGARLMKEEGAKRVVLARELTFPEVKAVTDIDDLEIEVFVHGALCYGYSGQCMFSSSIGSRSGNRGRCAQSCRLPYKLLNGESVYIFSPKDMCGLDSLKLMNNVDSLKIEGRMKSPDYVGVVTAIYRKYLDLASEIKGESDYKVMSKDLDALRQVFNRGGFNKGYLISNYDSKMMSINRPNHEGVFIGEIKSLGKGEISFKAKQDLYKGDVIDLRENDRDLDITLTSPANFKSNDNVTLKCPKVKDLSKGIKLYRMKSNQLVEDIVSELENDIINVKMQVKFIKSEPINIKIRNLSNLVEVSLSGPEVEAAIKAPVTKEALAKALNKLGGTSYNITSLDIDISDDAFMPVGAIKEIRRQAFDKLEEKTHKKYLRECADKLKDIGIDKANNSDNNNAKNSINDSEYSSNIKLETNKYNYISLSNYEQYKALDKNYPDYKIILPYEIIDQIKDEDISNIYIAFPHMFREKTSKLFANDIDRLAKVKGYLCSSIDSLAFVLSHKELALDIIIDDSLYAFNSISYDHIRDVISRYNKRLLGVIAPLEATFKELAKVDRPYIITLYGKERLMTTALCVKRNLGKCDKNLDYLTLIDRKGRKLKVYSDCAYCYDDTGRRNIIYNDEPINFNEADIDKNIELSGVLYTFADEEPLEVINILKGDTTIDKNYGHRFNGVD
ncbi:MAG: U32 family peptidase [Lachnospiraceae bacterium]|nr:U32 family peptidase [Lachnospiraceae bacterium]